MKKCLFDPSDLDFFPPKSTEYPYAPAVPQALRVFGCVRDFRKNQVRKIHFSWCSRIWRLFFQCTFRVYLIHFPQRSCKTYAIFSPSQNANFFFVPLDAKIWIHLTLFWEWNTWWLRWNLDILCFQGSNQILMAQNESYQPGTWISKKMSSTFLAKSPSSKKKKQFSRWWFNLLSNIF